MLKAGQVIPLKFKGREFRAVIIDPDGFGYNRQQSVSAIAL